MNSVRTNHDQARTTGLTYRIEPPAAISDVQFGFEVDRTKQKKRATSKSSSLYVSTQKLRENVHAW